MTVNIIPNVGGNSKKLADAELHFDEGDGILRGYKLVGFAVWRPTPGWPPIVTFPARLETVTGESRYFVLLRQIDGSDSEALREAILTAYDSFTQGMPGIPVKPWEEENSCSPYCASS